MVMRNLNVLFNRNKKYIFLAKIFAFHIWETHLIADNRQVIKKDNEMMKMVKMIEK